MNDACLEACYERVNMVGGYHVQIQNYGTQPYNKNEIVHKFVGLGKSPNWKHFAMESQALNNHPKSLQ